MPQIQKIFICLFVLLSFDWLEASDWPNFRGPLLDGFLDEKLTNRDWNKSPPKELWRIELGDKGYAGPSVAAGKLFIIDHKENRDVVRAVDIKTGKNAWTYEYVDTDQDDYGFAHATPTFNDGRVYTLSRLGLLHCLKADDGALIWKSDIKTKYGGRWRGNNWGYAASPIVDGDKLIVCPGGPDATVVALNKITGAEIWKGGGNDQPGYATPVKATLGGKPQYVVFTGLNAIGVDTENGTRLWSSPWRTSYDVNAASPVVVGNTVFVSSGYGTGCGLIDPIAATPPKEVWKNKTIKAHFTSPLYYEGHLYGVGEPGELTCIAHATGELKWRQTGFQKGGLLGIDGHVLAMNGSDGDVVLCKLTPEKFEELGRITPLGGQSWTAPIVSDGKLYVRNTTALVCLDLNPGK